MYHSLWSHTEVVGGVMLKKESYPAVVIELLLSGHPAVTAIGRRTPNVIGVSTLPSHCKIIDRLHCRIWQICENH